MENFSGAQIDSKYLIFANVMIVNINFVHDNASVGNRNTWQPLRYTLFLYNFPIWDIPFSPSGIIICHLV